MEVYSVTNLTTATLCVPCTWAQASATTGLIVSTSHPSKEMFGATRIQFALHDGVTGFHVGDFTIPWNDSDLTVPL
ncbi:hypothetical protein Pelo_19847 [Pelomyxa schiedti]|nr:hypothetical protein Pelo_19847 [Pelomyxa schiedti]